MKKIVNNLIVLLIFSLYANGCSDGSRECQGTNATIANSECKESNLSLPILDDCQDGVRLVQGNSECVDANEKSLVELNSTSTCSSGLVPLQGGGCTFSSSIAPMLNVSWYRPPTNTSWQWQLNATVNTSYSVDIYDIDLFDSSKNLIEQLQADGKKVICYFCAGSWESYRSDADSFPDEVLGSVLDGWEDEKWLDIRNEKLIAIMKKRLDLAVEKGCDGVEPDNMDAYQNSSGFNLTAKDQLAYNKFIANEAHERNLSVALKNDLNQIVELEPYYDFSVNEQCHQYEECSYLQPFIDANKPVLTAEYADKYRHNTDGARDTLCSETINMKFKTLVLDLSLDDSFRYACDD